jgi:uncharacterized protein
MMGKADIPMPYQLIDHHDLHVDGDSIVGHLLKHEAESCVQLGLIKRIRGGFSPISADEVDQPILWTVGDGTSIDLVAIQTLKCQMIVTRGSAGALAVLADGLARRNWDGSALVGVTPSVGALVDGYSALSRRQAKLDVRLRVFQLDAVNWPKPVSGSMRLCRSEDVHVLGRFITGFHAAINDGLTESPLAQAERVIADGRRYVWLDPEPVAMAGYSGPTPNGVRVNAVYTPPEFRGRGYASNLVAQLSQHLLDQGRKYCFLFTDQANPTSNSIYQKIGYCAVSDSERWVFGEPAVVPDH